MTTIQPMPTENPWINKGRMIGTGRYDNQRSWLAKSRVQDAVNMLELGYTIPVEDVLHMLVWQYFDAITAKRKAELARMHEMVQYPDAIITAVVKSETNVDFIVAFPATEAPVTAPAYAPGDVANGHVLAVVDGAYQWLPLAV